MSFIDAYNLTLYICPPLRHFDVNKTGVLIQCCTISFTQTTGYLPPVYIPLYLKGTSIQYRIFYFRRELYICPIHIYNRTLFWCHSRRGYKSSATAFHFRRKLDIYPLYIYSHDVRAKVIHIKGAVLEHITFADGSDIWPLDIFPQCVILMSQ